MPIVRTGDAQGPWCSIAMVFQEPMTALNPLLTIGDQIGEMFRIHTDLDKAAIEAKVMALLEEVRIPDPARAYAAYPHELSGGQRQRCMIAMAARAGSGCAHRRRADHRARRDDAGADPRPHPGPAESARARRCSSSTHDFGVVAEIADRGRGDAERLVVEQGPARAILTTPQHPHTSS